MMMSRELARLHRETWEREHRLYSDDRETCEMREEFGTCIHSDHTK